MHTGRNAQKWSQVPFCCLLLHVLLVACSVNSPVATIGFSHPNLLCFSHRIWCAWGLKLYGFLKRERTTFPSVACSGLSNGVHKRNLNFSHQHVLFFLWILGSWASVSLLHVIDNARALCKRGATNFTHVQNPLQTSETLICSFGIDLQP